MYKDYPYPTKHTFEPEACGKHRRHWPWMGLAQIRRTILAMASGESPERRDHAVHRRILSATFGERRLTRCAVDESDKMVCGMMLAKATM